MADQDSTKQLASEVVGQAEKKRGRKKLLFRILLDTNQLYTGSASDLLRAALRELIEASRQHNDVQIEWYLPEIVRAEREYQMASAGTALLPNLEKLERLIGHSIGINAEILRDRVRAAINKQVGELGLTVYSLNASEVDWPSIVSSSVNRIPPFEAGEKEKGFRDAIVIESFAQVVTSSPKNPSVCRIAVVTGEKLVAEAISARVAASTNVRVLNSLEDLKSLMNTLVSDVTEQFVAGIRELAGNYFYDFSTKEGLYVKEKVYERIRDTFASKLGEVPPGATSRENDSWQIHPPTFIKKSGQRVTWQSTIKVSATSYKTESPNSNQLWIEAVKKYMSASPSERTNPALQTNLFGSAVGMGVGDTLALVPRKIESGKGSTVFQITWSAVVTSTKKFMNPKVEAVDYKETTWQ